MSSDTPPIENASILVAQTAPEIDSVHPMSEEPRRLYFGWKRRIPFVRQSEASECGLACLAMVAAFHGQYHDLPSLRRHFSLSLKGVTLSQLIDMGQSLGMVGRPLRLETNELCKLQMPCILHWDLDHFVVLQSVKKHSIKVLDPAFGERLFKWDDVSKHFTGVALELSVGPKFKRAGPPPAISLRALAGSIQGLGKALTTIFCLALALEFFSLLGPLLLQMVVDQVIADGDKNLLTLLGVSFILLILLQTLFSALRTWTVMWLGSHFSLSWSGNVFQHLLKLPHAYFLKRHLGDIVSRFGSISIIQQTLTTQFISVILDGLMTILTLLVMIWYSLPLAFMTSCAFIFYGVLRTIYFRVYQESNLSQIIVSARQQSIFMEAVRGTQTLRLYNQGPAQTSRFINATTDSINTSIAVQRLNLLFGSIESIAGGAQRVGVLWFGAWLALRGQFSAGMLMAFVAYSDQFTSRGAALVDYAIQFRLLRLQGERVADIVMTPPEPFAEGSYVGPDPEASISFEKVSFRYGEGESWILKECSFEIKEGDSVAIIGPSGCGKTTLMRLLLGLLDPQEGRIRIGGIDIRHLGKSRFRRIIGSVLQDDRLFTGTIAENISFFCPNAEIALIQNSAKLAQIDQDILAMPMGYHSLVGDMGSALSGGQQQRVLLARAFFCSPQILMLDEATSNLDLKCEAAINSVLQDMPLTRVVIAHRAETIASAKRVFNLNHGSINEINVGDDKKKEMTLPDLCLS